MWQCLQCKYTNHRLLALLYQVHNKGQSLKIWNLIIPVRARESAQNLTLIFWICSLFWVDHPSCTWEKTCPKQPLTAWTFLLKYLFRGEGNTLLNVAFPVVFNHSYCLEATWGYKHATGAIWSRFWSSQTVPVVTHSCATLPKSVAGMAQGPEHMLESFLLGSHHSCWDHIIPLGITSGCLPGTIGAAFPKSRSDKSWPHTHSHSSQPQGTPARETIPVGSGRMIKWTMFCIKAPMVQAYPALCKGMTKSWVHPVSSPQAVNFKGSKSTCMASKHNNPLCSNFIFSSEPFGAIWPPFSIWDFISSLQSSKNPIRKERWDPQLTPCVLKALPQALVFRRLMLQLSRKIMPAATTWQHPNVIHQTSMVCF